MQESAVIENRYRLTKQICSAWLAVDQRDGQQRILKNEMSFAEPAVVDVLAQLWHPGIPRLLDKVENGADKWLVFEYVEGKTLEEKIISDTVGVTEGQVLEFMLDMAKILDFLHRQMDRPLLHLDIKPANIVLNEAGRPILIDFNSARFFPPEHNKENSFVSCTADYAAPELLHKKPCPASDIYSLALSAAELLRGEIITRGQGVNIASVLQGSSQRIQLLLRKCLHVDPEKRISSAGELACEISIMQNNSKQGLDLPVIETGDQKQAASQSPGEKQGRIISIWGEAEFGCELASFIAEDKKVLVIDADLLFPHVDMLLDLKPGPVVGTENSSSGFDLALREKNNVCLTRDSLRNTLVESEKKNLYVLYPVNDLSSYEQYNPENLFRILRLGQTMFDYIFIVCSRFIYDAFTCLGFVAAELVLVPLAADFPSFRHINRLLGFLAARQICDWDKIRYIAFSYQGKSDLSWGTMDELCEGRLYGCISQSSRRIALRNEKKSYAMCMSKKNVDEYRALARKLGLAD